MSVVVFAESSKGILKKAAFEAVYYGRKTADQLGTDCIAITIGPASNASELGLYGAQKTMQLAPSAEVVDSKQYSAMISEAAEKLSAQVLVMSHTSTGKGIAPRVAVRLNAGLISGANALPKAEGSFIASKGVFSGKAIASFDLGSNMKVISVMGNALSPEVIGEAGSPESMEVNVPPSSVERVELKTVDGIVPLPEAELVVSAGRGMKGPENWGIIDELAGILGATTACSRPVADVGWRPHHEHVGQTGIAIRPNLYIAIGISGAIQHLAGVNNSKVIVVINKDPEAPFFGAADYGVLGDLFDVVPRLNEALKKFKESA